MEEVSSEENKIDLGVASQNGIKYSTIIIRGIEIVGDRIWRLGQVYDARERGRFFNEKLQSNYIANLSEERHR